MNTAIVTVAENACVLLSAAEQRNTIADLADSGVALLLPFAVAMAVLVLGVSLVVAAIRRRRTEKGRGRRNSAAGMLALALILGATASALPFATTTAQAIEAADRCDLIDYTIDRAQSAGLLGADRSELERATITNITNGTIDLSFSARIDDDSTRLAPFIHMVGSCGCAPSPLIDAILADGIPAGSSVRILSGESVTVVISANTTAEISNVHQGAAMSYSLVAHASEVVS